MPSYIWKEIGHNFKVAQLGSFKGDECYEGDKVSVTHNDTPVWFQLCITPADSKHQAANRRGVYLKYVDGPQENISIRLSLYIMRETRLLGQHFNAKYYVSGTDTPRVPWITTARGDSVGTGTLPYHPHFYWLPCRRSDLESKGYIRQDDTILIGADVYVSLDAFEESSTLDCVAAPSVSSCSGGGGGLAKLFANKMPSHICKEIEQSFQVSQLGAFKTDERYEGGKASVTHDGTTISFQLLVAPADSKLKSTNRMGVYLKYVDGPHESIRIKIALFVMEQNKKRRLFETRAPSTWITLPRGDSWDNSTVPYYTLSYYLLKRRRSDLKCYIRQDDTILIRAVVYISFDAFEAPSCWSLSASIASVSRSSEYISKDLNQSLAPKTSPTPIPEVTEEKQLAIAIQESEEEEKERQRQLDLFHKYNGPDVGLGQRLSHTEVNANLKDGLVTGKSTNTPPTPTRDQKLYPSLAMKEELREQKQKDMAGSDALSTPADAQQTLESPPINSAPTNDQFPLGLREQINSLKSNQTHGRSIVNDWMIEALFVSLTSQHGALLERMQTLGDKRVHYCWLQERMAEIGELRRALDELRNEEKRKKQIIIQQKLTRLRTHKHVKLSTGDFRIQDMPNSFILLSCIRKSPQMLEQRRFQHQEVQYGQEPITLPRRYRPNCRFGCSAIIGCPKDNVRPPLWPPDAHQKSSYLMRYDARLLTTSGGIKSELGHSNRPRPANQQRVLNSVLNEQRQLGYSGRGRVMSNFGVWPQFGLGMHQSQRTPSYNPSHTISQQPMIMQQYSNSHYAYPSPQYVTAAPPQMCPQMPGADQQGNNTNQPDVGLLIDL